MNADELVRYAVIAFFALIALLLGEKQIRENK